MMPGPAGPDGPGDSGLAPISLVNAAWNALTYVHDPELYLDLVSLGLVYDVRAEDGTIVVEMTLARAGSPACQGLPEMARAAVAEAVGDGRPVDVRLVWDPPWSPQMIDSIAARALGFRIR